jgi:hypothetical protein
MTGWPVTLGDGLPLFTVILILGVVLPSFTVIFTLPPFTVRLTAGAVPPLFSVTLTLPGPLPLLPGGVLSALTAMVMPGAVLLLGLGDWIALLHTWQVAGWA